MGQLNYLNNQQGDKAKSSSKPNASAPDSIVHTPPIVHYFLGLVGILFGFSANLWQVFTTILALVQLMTPSGAKFSFASMGWKLGVAVIIACATQFGLTIMVWRIDTTWKRKNASTGSSSQAGQMLKGYGLAAVEVVQHVDLVTAWGLISFCVDTVGDFTFVSSVLTGIGLTQTVFLTFLYAISLYALSTIGFVRSVEYIWAGLISSANYVKQHQQQSTSSTTTK